MRYKHFKNANVDVSSLAIGTWAIGGARYGEVNEEDSINAIHTMIDKGVNLIDTAPAYNCGVRNVEEAIENCAAFDWVLTEQELAIIDAKLKELNI